MAKNSALVSQKVNSNRAMLIRHCIAFAAGRGLTDKHRFVLSPVNLCIIGDKITIEQHADLALVEASHGSPPHVIDKRACSATTEV